MISEPGKETTLELFIDYKLAQKSATEYWNMLLCMNFA